MMNRMFESNKCKKVIASKIYIEREGGEGGREGGS